MGWTVCVLAGAPSALVLVLWARFSEIVFMFGKSVLDTTRVKWDSLTFSKLNEKINTALVSIQNEAAAFLCLFFFFFYCLCFIFPLLVSNVQGYQSSHLILHKMKAGNLR